MIWRDLQEALKVLRLLRTPLHCEKIDDLDKQQRLAAARFFHRLDQLAQTGNESIIADAEQWTTRNVAYARRFDHQHTRPTFSKALVPVEVLLRHESIFSRTPWHHRRHPRATERFEPADFNRTEQARTRSFV